MASQSNSTSRSSNKPEIQRSPTLEEIKLLYKRKTKAKSRVQMKSSDCVYDYAKSIWEESAIDLMESAYCLFLDRRNAVIGWLRVASGGLDGTLVDQRLIFATALKCAARYIILMHNHPSGNLKASSSDISLTRKIKESGELLDIPLIDHLIITSEDYYSFANEGYL